jgi:hypothetical protein
MKINVKAINEAIKRNNEEFAFIPNKFEIEDIECVETVKNGYGRDNVRQTINIYIVNVSYKAKKYEDNRAVYKVWYYEDDKEACANWYGSRYVK